MQILFSQGIIRGKTDISSNTRLFLQPNSSYVSLYVTDMKLVATTAHKTKNYLIEEPNNVSNAWGPLQAIVLNYL